MELKRIGITHGDVNGVGYEVILKSLSGEGITELFTPVIFGVPDYFNKAKETFGLNELSFNFVKDASEAKDGKINIVSLNFKPELHPGEVRKDAGESAVEALESAVTALENGDIDALVTAPISKEAVQSESFKFPGHTEFLTERLGDGEEAMMILCNGELRVALLTVHLPVTRISENIKKENLEAAIRKLIHTLRQDFGIVRPSVGVLSLNPHAGDGGLLGTEEEEIIKPVIEKLQDEGYLAFGPFAADGFFGHGNYKQFDGVLAMYHDQGLAPFKTIATTGGVNFSASLPYVRTSPDHGTAFDIAWQGIAQPDSMRDAIYMAIDILRRREGYLEAASNPLKKHVQERPEKPDRNDRNQFKLDSAGENMDKAGEKANIGSDD